MRRLLGMCILGACGVTEGRPCLSEQASPIINGVADINTLPEVARDSVVRVEIWQNVQLTAICSGVLVSADWILTAKHCGTQAQQTLRVAADGPKAFATDVDHQVAHPSSDLLLLHLLTPALGRPLLPIVSARDLRTSDAVLLAGYGRNETGQQGVLGFAESLVLDVDPATVRVTSFGRAGACAGDSGGPLFWQRDGHVGLIGVLSGGSSTCRGVDAYTRVDGSIAWLSAIVADDLCLEY